MIPRARCWRLAAAAQQCVVASIVPERQDAYDIRLGEDPFGEGVFPGRQLQRGADVHWQVAQALAE